MKVTVFIPVYNAEKYIRPAIESILNQSFKDFELLIIDDGSTDNSVEIIKSYNDVRIRILENERNMGIPFTRNRGLKEAKGEYFAIMDSDDIAMKDRLQLQVEYLDKHKDIGVVTSSYYDMYKNINFRKSTKIDNDIYIKANLMFDSYICNPATMVRMSSLENTKYNEDCFVCQDYDLWVQLCRKNIKFGAITKPLLKYRKGHNNITKKSNKEKREKRNKLLLDIRKNQFENCGFHLEHDELILINTFMDYNNRNIRKVYDCLRVFTKILEINKQTHVFEEIILRNVLKEVIVKQISICNCGYNEKVAATKYIFEGINTFNDININSMKYLYLKDKLITFVKRNLLNK